MTEILKFRAGVADFDESSNICSPKPIKGEIVVKPSEEAEGFYDLEWNATEKVASGNVEPIELILIPGTTKWVHVKSSKNGRIFCLVFSSDEKYFFWLQDKNQGCSSLNELSTADKAIADKFDELLNAGDEEEDQQVSEDADVDMDAPTQPSPEQTSNQ